MAMAPIFKFDVMAVAKGILDEVERHRSYLPEYGGKDGTQNVKNRPVESRVNTFFRLVGFPSIVSVQAVDKNSDVIGGKPADAKVLTPGWSRSSNIRALSNAKVRTSESDSITVPTADGSSREKLSQAVVGRETTLSVIENSIGTSFLNNAMTAAFKNPMPLAMNYVRGSKAQTKGQESAGTQAKFDREIYKRLSPFATNYMVVTPSSREIAKPFLSDPRDGFLVNDELKRPFLETVARIRLAKAQQSEKSEQQEYFAEVRQNLTKSTESAYSSKVEQMLIADLVPGQGSLVESFVVEQLLSVVPQIAKKWVSLIRRLEDIKRQGDFILTPVTGSSRQSPLGKRANTQASLQVSGNTELNMRIKQIDARVEASKALVALLPIEESVSKKDWGSEAYARNVMSNALTRPFVFVLRQDMDYELKKLSDEKRKLNELVQKADRLRFEMEMMTGEFAGLSVVDVVFTMTALFLVDRQYIVDMFDSNTVDEMKKDKTLSTIEANPGPAKALAAIGEVESKVKDLYDLLDASIASAIIRSKRTRNKPQHPQARSNKITRTVEAK